MPDLRQWLDKLPDAARKAVKHVKMKKAVGCCSRPESNRKRVREETTHALRDLDVLVEVQFVSMRENYEALRSESMGRWI